jgi:hypothetical protein
MSYLGSLLAFLRVLAIESIAKLWRIIFLNAHPEQNLKKLIDLNINNSSDNELDVAKQKLSFEFAF